MNFFGHAAVASWSAASAGVALGAMLPDFASMSGARIDHTTDHEVTAGIALHHATDAAFHRLPVVTGLMRELDDRLLALGCARGPRRAVAHIGVELLLDGVLVDELAYREAYTAGIAYDAEIYWRFEGDDQRFTQLIARLRAHGVPDDLRRPEAITTRLARALAHRPLLAPGPDDLVAIRIGMIEHQPRVRVAAAAILRSLGAALGHPGSTTKR